MFDDPKSGAPGVRFWCAGCGPGFTAVGLVSATDGPGQRPHMTWWELADSVYLASVIGDSRRAHSPDADEPEPDLGEPLPSSDDAELVPPGSGDIAEGQSTEDGEARHVHLLVGAHERSTPRRRPLPDATKITRALRPLKRTMRSAREDAVILDVDATSERAVFDGVWWPITKPDTQRWLDLTVVVDSSPSMALWRSRVNGFVTLLERLGAFRTMQVRLLDTREDPLVLRGSTLDTPSRTASELLDPTGRRVLLILTDGVHECWRQDLVGPMLAEWGRVMPVCVVNLLPERMWRRSGLAVHRVRLSGCTELAPNHRLRATPMDAWLDFDVEPSRHGFTVPTPVIELAADSLDWWARLVTGAYVEPVDAQVLLTDSSPVSPFVNDHAPPGELLSIVDQVSHFRSVAAPPALRLATLLAAVPATVQVARLLQAKLAPESGPEHLAEVFNSGLLRPDAADWAEASFDFPGEARELLLTGARRSDTARAIRVAAERFGDRFGVLCTLRDALVAPDTTPIPESPDEIELDRTVMRALSGPYTSRADRMSPTPLPQPRKRTRPEREADRPEGMPPVWGSIPPRNPNFTGRDELLALLSDRLRADGTLPVVLHGMGGIGKTQIAVEYIYRTLNDYEIFWWVQAAQPAQVRGGLTELAQYLGLRGGQEAHTAVPAVLEVLRAGSAGRWLLVFDSAGFPDEVRPYFPGGGPGDILITSRNPDWATSALPIEVPVFSRAETLALLRLRNPEIEDADADRLAERLGYLPLAVEQASAWRALTGMPVEEYLRLFDEKRAEIAGLARPADDLVLGAPADELSVAAVWSVSFESLRERNPAAHQLMEVCAFFAPEPVSRNLFTGVRGVSISPELDAALGDPPLLSRAIRDINHYGLAKIDHRSNTLQLHRLVQMVLRNRMTAEERTDTRHIAHVLLANADPKDPASSKQWHRYQEVLPHAYESELIYCDDPWVRQLVINLGRFLYFWGDHLEAAVWLQHAVDEWSQSLGEADQQSLQAASLLGMCLWALGRYPEAAEINKRTLALRRQVSGEDSEETIMAELRVGVDVKARGEFYQARELNERSYRKAMRLYGEGDPITLQTAHDLAVTLRLCGDYKTALSLDERTYQRRRGILGYDNMRTLNTLTGLILDRQLLGHYSQARREHEEVARRVRAILGADKADTLRRNGYLAVARRKDGAHREALDLSAVTLRLSRQRYGDDHPESMACAIAHSIDLRHADRLGEAQALSEQTFERYRNKLGERHPHTLTAAIDLAVVLRVRGDARSAKRFTEESLTQFQATLGADHPYTVICMIELASNLSVLGDRQAATRLGDEALSRSARVLGPDHPTTLAAGLNLALDQRIVADAAQAEGLFQATVARFQRVLGASHPAVVAAKNRRRADCDIDPLPG